MRFDSGEDFIAQRHKRITLMGMSNIGKTTLAASLPANRWFHYSVDYRLATAYLKEPIVDLLKKEMMTIPHLAAHLRADLFHIDLNVSFGNLDVVSHYLAKLGSENLGGVSMAEFRQRQERHRKAEMQAVLDVPEFISKGIDIYDYDHFINDASGSLCEIIDLDDDDDAVLRSVTDDTVLIYLQADAERERILIDRAARSPKPLYYRPEFLKQAVHEYLAASDLESVNSIEPDGFVRWVFPRLMKARRSRYERIAARHGYTMPARDIIGLSEVDFLDRIARLIDERER